MLKEDNADDLKIYHFQGFCLDISKRCLFDPDGKIVPLSTRALDTLQLLVQNRGKTLSKAYLVGKIWPDSCVEENNLNQAVTKLRKALGDSKLKGNFIKTVTGRGYCFVAELEPVEKTQHKVSDSAFSLERKQQQSLVNQSSQADSNSRFFWNKYSQNRMLVTAILPLFFIISLATYFLPASSDQDNNLPPTSPLTLNLNNPEIENSFSYDEVKLNLISNSIVIFPFTNLSSEIETELFTIGLQDKFNNQLNYASALRLIPQESTLQQDFAELSPMEIARKLQVENFVIGTIHYTERYVKINLQILETETGLIQWAYSHNIDTSDKTNMVYAQNEIAKKIIEGHQVSFHGMENMSKPSSSFEAFRYNVAARHAYNLQEFAKSWELTKLALEIDPEYLGALYNFSKANIFLASMPMPEMNAIDHINQAMESADRIIELAPKKHEGYVLKAAALGASKNWKAAMNELQLLKQMNTPIESMELLASTLLSLGEFESAIKILEDNLKIDPINGYSRGFLIAAYESVGNKVQARLEYGVGEKLNRQWWGDAVNVFLSLGRNEVVNIDQVYGLSDETLGLFTYLENKDYSSLKQALSNKLYQTEAIQITAARSIYYSALAAYIQEHELSTDYMKLATQDLGRNMYWFWLPLFQETRQTSGFNEVLEQVGLVEYWQEHGWPTMCQPNEYSFTCL